MTERDRVLDAFRNCITEPKCKDCPWTECETIGNSTIEIPRDLALAVMRELVTQEPRVMTLEEVRRFVYGSPYIIETNLPDDEPRLMYGLYSHQGIVGNFDFSIIDGRKSLFDADYGKTWRCWTARPTDEQREAAKWDE